MKLFVEFLSAEGGKEEILSRCVKVSQVIEHLQRKYPGRFPDLKLKYYDQVLKDDQLLKDLLEEDEDILELGALEKKAEDADKLRACLTTECRIVFKQKDNKIPQFLYPGDAPYEFNTSFVQRNESFVVLRDAQEREDGEPVWIGYRYKLPKDNNILQFEVKKEGVFKRMKNKVEKIEPVGEAERVCESVFFMPVSDHTWFGQPLPVFIKNKTGNRILAISGGSKRFKKLNLDPVSGDDDRAQHIKIRKVNTGYKLGLTTREYLDRDGNAVYDTDMYKVPGRGIRLIEIERWSQGYRVTPIKTNDERLNPLQKVDTKTFRQSDKDFWRNFWTRGLIAGGSAVIAGVVGGFAEGAFGEVFSTADAGAFSMDSGDVSMDTGDVSMDTVDSLETGVESGNQQDDMAAPLSDGRYGPISGDCN